MKEEKQKLIEKEISEMKSEGKNSVQTFSLADLVMLQMAGDFPQFLGTLSGGSKKANYFDEAQKIIEKTKEEVTTYDLFPNIVQKTIEAQFGDKTATVRELGQNAIDAYSAKYASKEVIFDFSEGKDYDVLKCRDFGCGMTLEEIIRDLLVPYNSGKEFDPTKIGEHGIGWYSIVDLADMVKVVSKSKETDETVQAVVYNEGTYNKGQQWKATLLPHSKNGFSEDIMEKSQHGKSKSGTEVIAYIPSNTLSDSPKINLKNALYQYLGMVDPKNATIKFEEDIINSAREAYQEAAPVDVVITGKRRPMIMGVSKREINNDPSADSSKFVNRNKNLEKILYTQRGLFIKYDSMPFEENTIHRKLMADLMEMGADFWVDVPDNVTLTKGRNNIIADHGFPVLDGTYRAFEGLFLDVLLNDEEMLNHPSNALLSSIAEIFDKNYAAATKGAEERRYSSRRKTASLLAKIGSGVVDVSAYVLGGAANIAKIAAVGIGKGAKYAAIGIGNGAKNAVIGTGNGIKYIFTKMPGDIVNLTNSVNEYLTENTPAMKKVLAAGGSGAAALGASGYALYQLHKHFGWTPFIYTGAAAAAAAGIFGGVKLAGAIADHVKENGAKKTLDELLTTSKDIAVGTAKFGAGVAAIGGLGLGLYKIITSMDPKFLLYASGITAGAAIGGYLIKKGFDAVDDVAGFFSSAYSQTKSMSKALLNTLGLYVDIEEKREKKRQKIRKRISKKYLSKMKKNEFFRRIMNKEIIPAEYYYSTAKEQQRQLVPSDSIFDMVQSSFTGRAVYKEQITYKEGKIECQNKKISIEEMIDLYLRRKLKYAEFSDQKPHDFSDGDYFVLANNPLTKTVIAKLDELKYKVNEAYNVKVLEDHLSNMWHAAKETGAFLYVISPIGIVHMIGDAIINRNRENRGNPVAGTKAGDLVEKIRSILGNTWNDREIIAKHVGNGAKIIASAPFIGAYALLKGGAKLGYNTARWAGRKGRDAAKGLYDRLILPAAKTLDPRKYPAYYEALAKFIKKKGEDYAAYLAYMKKQGIADREARMQKKIESAKAKKDEIKIQKPKVKKPNIDYLAQFRQNFSKFAADINERRQVFGESTQSFFENMYENISDWYKDSALFTIFGYGLSSGEEFKELRKNRLKAIVDCSGVGKSYYNLLNAMENADRLVSNALKMNAYDISYSRESLGCNTEGFDIKKRGKALDIRLNEIYSDREFRDLLKDSVISSENENAERDAVRFSYRVLDEIIHLKTHNLLEYYKHETALSGRVRTKAIDNVEHPEEFYETKEQLRQNVIDYLEKNKIDVAKEITRDSYDSSAAELRPSVEHSLAELSKNDNVKKREIKGIVEDILRPVNYAYIYDNPEVKALSELVHMTRRKLLSERTFKETREKLITAEINRKIAAYKSLKSSYGKFSTSSYFTGSTGSTYNDSLKNYFSTEESISKGIDYADDKDEGINKIIKNYPNLKKNKYDL